MNLVFGDDQRIADWVGNELGIVMAPPYTAIGGTRDGSTIEIGVVFNNWNGANLDISLVSRRGLSRGAIRAVYHYVFKQAKARRLTAITRRSNELMQRQLPRFGFELEGESRCYFGDEDALRYVLLPELAKKWMD